jgi:uncharacterized protein YhaN
VRLISLALTNYGPFRAERIALDPRPGRINLLIAPNGYGKSVLRGAFCDLLFGVHPQTAMGFRFGYAGMRLMAEAVAPDGERFTFGRRKGQGNTLIGADGATLEPAALARLLGATDRALLERLFALDTARLREGGAELLASGGTLADALLSAAGGLRRARQVRQGLEEARDQLAPLRKSQGRPFYRALDRFQEARRRLDAEVLKPDLRVKQETELRQLQTDLHARNKLAEAAAERGARLQRVRRVVGVLRQHDDAADWLARHPDALNLPPETGERLRAADEALRRAEQLLERERGECHDAAERLAQVRYDAAALAAAEAIDRLIDRAGAAEQARRDIPKRAAELEATEAQIARLLGQLGLALPPDRAAEAIPRRADIVAARRLFTGLATLRAERDRLPGEITRAEHAIAAIAEKIARLPATADTSAVAREVRDIRRAGDPAERMEAAARIIAEREAACVAARARLPVRPDGAAPPLPLAAYERLHGAVAAAEAALGQSLHARQELGRALDAERAQHEAIAAAGPLPDAAAIAAARAQRDQGWQLIHRRAFTATPPTAAEEAAWAGTESLALAYERAVNAADMLADQRISETDRLARTAEIARRIADLQARLAAAERACAEAEAACATARAPWQASLAALGLDGGAGLEEVRALLAAHDRLIEADRDLALARDAAERLQAQQAAAAQRLAAALGAGDAHGAADLPVLLRQAEQRIEAAQMADKARAELHGQLNAQQRARDEAADALAQAERRWDALLGQWAQVRQALGRPEQEAPETTEALLDQFAELEAAVQRADELRRRLREMQEELAGFGADATGLAKRLAPGHAGADAFAIAAALRELLTQHRRNKTQWDTLHTQHERARERVRAQEAEYARRAIELRALLDSIGAASATEAQPLVALAAERAAQVETLRRCAAQLARDGDGHDVNALRLEAAQCAIDQVPGEIEAADAERRRATQEAQELTARIARMQAEMDAQARATGALEAAAEQQAAAAAIARALDDALLLHLAALLLEQAIDEVDAAGSSALLTRIGARFRTITAGAYERLVAEDSGDGAARLLAVERGFPDERKAIAELSDGTRDQLFLALRLVAIEDHVAAAPPLPFIGDDILQTFDDGRAMAALEALLELSAHVQVILLSHHPHLLALARDLGRGNVHVCEIAAVPA